MAITVPLQTLRLFLQTNEYMLKRIFLLLAIIVSAFAVLGMALQLGAPTGAQLMLAPTATPSIDVATTLTIDEDLTHTLLLTVTDDVSSTLALSVDSGSLSTSLTPMNVTVDAGGLVTAELLLMPTEADGFGTYPITITVSDDEVVANVISETVTVTVNEVNITPTVGLIADQAVDEGTLLSIPIVNASEAVS